MRTKPKEYIESNPQGITLHAFYGDDVEWSESVYDLEFCPMESATYWVAADGKTFGLKSKDACLSIVERAIRMNGAKQTNVVFGRTCNLQNWIKKWSKRTQ